MPKLKKINNRYVLEDISIGKANDMLLSCGDSLEVKVQLVDFRLISDKQRKFVFALCRDIADYIGDDKEYIRAIMMSATSEAYEFEDKSLSAYTMTQANKLIDVIVSYAFKNEIPVNAEDFHKFGYEFNSKQIYSMILNRTCCICGRKADIHHVDHIGMGNDRNKISHIGKRVLPLCRVHHTEAHTMSNEKFIDKYHLTTCVVDKKLEYFIKKGKLKEFKE